MLVHFKDMVHYLHSIGDVGIVQLHFSSSILMRNSVMHADTLYGISDPDCRSLGKRHFRLLIGMLYTSFEFVISTVYA